MERLTLKIAVYAFFIKEGKILLARRFKTGWQDGNYSLPAGHLDPNESLADCMVREIKEEVGLSVESSALKFVHVMHRKTHIDFFLSRDFVEGEPVIGEPDKCDELRWSSIDDLPQNVVPSVRFAIENYQKGISLSEFTNEG